MRLRASLSAAVLLAAAPAGLVAQQTAAPAPTAPSPAATSTSGPTSGVIPLDRVVAVIGDVVVTQSTLRERLIYKKQAGERIPTDRAGYHAFSLAALNEIVDEELMVRKGKELKVEVPDADVASTVDKQYKAIRSQYATEAEFKSELVRAGYGTPEEYKRYIGDGIRRNELIGRTTKKLKEDGKMVAVNVSEADVQESFERNKADIPKNEATVTWRQIIVSPKPTAAAKDLARARAESLLAEIKRGGDFEQLARRESADSGSRVNGGDLGWNRRGAMVPEFDRWLFGYYALRPGNLSPVVETPFGYHIIRVDRVNAAEVKSRHILITAKVDSSDIARARLEADSVAVKWRAGAPFDTLAKKHHDYRGLEETTLLTPYPRAKLPAQYQAGFANAKPNDVVTFDVPGSGSIPVKVVVAQLASTDEGGDVSLSEWKERIRSRLSEAGGARRVLDAMRKSTYVSVRPEAISVTQLPATPTGS